MDVINGTEKCCGRPWWDDCEDETITNKGKEQNK